MTQTAPARAGRKEWIGLAVIALPCRLYSMDLTVLHLAVPQLSAQLKPTSAQLLWIIDIYGFLVAGSLITMGTLGDRIGRRRLLLIGAAAFGAAVAFAKPRATIAVRKRMTPERCRTICRAAARAVMNCDVTSVVSGSTKCSRGARGCSCCCRTPLAADPSR